MTHQTNKTPGLDITTGAFHSLAYLDALLDGIDGENEKSLAASAFAAVRCPGALVDQSEAEQFPAIRAAAVELQAVDAVAHASRLLVPYPRAAGDPNGRRAARFVEMRARAVAVVFQRMTADRTFADPDKPQQIAERVLTAAAGMSYAETMSAGERALFERVNAHRRGAVTPREGTGQ